MITINNGEICFGKKQKPLLCEMNVDIPDNKLSIVIGPNGAGKTSLINILAGITKLSQGEITNTFKKSILIPQKATYPEGICLYEYLSSVFYSTGWKWQISVSEKNKINEVLENLNLSEKKDLSLNKLSGGELQLANIALAILSGADFMVLDEPLSNMDILNQILILDILKKITSKGITIVLVTHDINFAARYGDNFIIVSKEGSVICGERDQILTTDNLSKAYNYKFKAVEIEEDIYIQPHI